MKRLAPFFILTACLASGTSRGRAEDLSTLTWSEVVQQAIQKNPELEAARNQNTAVKARYRGSYNGILPRVNLTSSYNDSANNGSRATRWRAGANASWDLFNLGQMASISAAKAAFHKSTAAFRSTSADVRENLFRSFAGLLYQQEVTQVSSTILSIRSNNARMVSLRYDSGRESKGNRMTSEAELLQAQMDASQARRDLRAAEQELNHQLGQDRYQTLKATGTLSAAISNQLDLDSLVDRHPLVAQRIADVASAKAGVRQARSDIFPTLTANYSRTFSDRTYFPNNATWSASGVFSLPIFGSGPTATFYAIRAASEERAAAENNLLAARAQIRADLESAWADFERGVDQVQVQDAFLKATRQRNAEADVRYSSGLMSYEDWSRIVTDRVNLEKSMIQARRDAALAEAGFRQTQGLGLEDER